MRSALGCSLVGGKLSVNTKQRTKKTPVENQMAEQLREAGLTGYRRNARFIEGRRFEADFFWPRLKLVLEVDGGVWMPAGGHTTGTGYTKDRRRDQLAAAQGISTVRFTSEQVRNGEAIAFCVAYFPYREREVALLQSDPVTSMGFASQLPEKYGTQGKASKRG